MTRPFVIVFSLLGFVATTAWADPGTEERLRNALRDTTRQLHDAQDELAALKGKQDSGDQELAALREQVATLKARAARAPEANTRSRREIERLGQENANLRAQVERARAEVDKARQTIEQWQQSQKQWQEGYTKTSDQARTSEGLVTELKGKLQQSDAKAAECAGKNQTLAAISRELLDRYRGKGVWDALIGAEPITQLQRVTLETLTQEYHAKIKDAEVSPPQQGEPPSSQP